MADQLSLRGGTTAEHATFTGANKEVTVDTTKKTLVVNDGATVGGHPLMRENASNSALALGSAGTPSLKFTGDTNTGIYSPGADQLAVATNGAGRLFVDSDGNIGIGGTTTTGWAQKQVVLDAGSGTSASYVLVNDTTGRAGTDGGLLTLSGSDLFLINREAANLIFRTSNAERLRITSAGLVGIGTSDAQNLLSLGLGSGTTTRILGQYGNNVSTTLEVGAGQASSFRGGMRIAVTDTGAGSVGDSVVSFHTTKDGGGTVQRLTIDQDGKVGIGTTSVDAKLHIQGVSGTYPTSIFNHSAIDVEGEVIRIGRTDSTARYHSIYGKQSAINSSNYLQFRVHDGSASSPFTSQSTVMTLTGQGRVGIGTTSPAEILHVNGAANPAINITGTSGSAIIKSSDRDLVYDARFGTHVWRNNGNEQVRIDSSSRLLIGTSTARSNFHNNANYTTQFQLEGTGFQNSALSLIANNTAPGVSTSITLAKSAGAGLTSNTLVANNELLGDIRFEGSNGTNFVEAARIRCEIDGGTPGAASMPGRLVFSTTADGAASPTEQMRITSDGTILVGITSPIITSNGFSLRKNSYFHATNTDQECILINRLGTDGAIVSIRKAGTAVGSISVTATATAYNTSSDYRLKENVTPVSDGIIRLQQLKPSRFNFIADPDTVVDGFIAHEVQTIVPEAITGEKDAVDDDGNPEYQGIDQSKLVPLLTAALQEAIGEIESLKARLTAAGI
jgi:hypothetical protein